MSETMTLHVWLKELGACGEAVRWAKDYESLANAWQACERPDWMLWLCGVMQMKEGWPDRKQIVSVTCDIAESVLHIYEKKYPNDNRVRNCIDVTRRWVNGNASIEDVRSARAAADAAYAAADAAATAAAYATYAAAAAADAAYATTAAAYAAAAAADAAYATTAAAAYAAAADAAKTKELCSLIRQKLEIPELVEVKL